MHTTVRLGNDKIPQVYFDNNEQNIFIQSNNCINIAYKWKKKNGMKPNVKIFFLFYFHDTKVSLMDGCFPHIHPVYI